LNHFLFFFVISLIWRILVKLCYACCAIDTRNYHLCIESRILIFVVFIYMAWFLKLKYLGNLPFI
jgi:hypothetical protein